MASTIASIVGLIAAALIFAAHESKAAGSGCNTDGGSLLEMASKLFPRLTLAERALLEHADVQPLGVLEVGGVEAFGEPVVDLGEYRADSARNYPDAVRFCPIGLTFRALADDNQRLSVGGRSQPSPRVSHGDVMCAYRHKAKSDRHHVSPKSAPTRIAAERYGKKTGS